MRNKIIKIACSIALCLVCLIIFEPINNIVALADGKAEIVMELSTSTILHQKNAQAKLPMASTTKIMTALIIIEDCDLDEEITVPDEAVGVEGSSIYLKHGEVISVRDLLYGLMLRSGNDSAAALAIHHSKNINNFVAKMNERAKELGLTDTQFTNPSGLPDNEHYTTAKDLCTLACSAMKNPTFKQIVGTKNYTGKYRSFVNKNKILNSVEGANGVKTGYTVKAGRCLVSSAERDNMSVVCVVLNCPDMYERSKELIDSAYKTYKVVQLDKEFMSDIVPCKLDNIYTLVAKRDIELQYEVENLKNKEKINKGDLVARLKIYSQNDLIFCQNLYSIITV
jgi:D-alanyl-D-alanine carboxypeptidase (penicillin-binding protein 5/6)